MKKSLDDYYTNTQALKSTYREALIYLCSKGLSGYFKTLLREIKSDELLEFLLSDHGLLGHYHQEILDHLTDELIEYDNLKGVNKL